MLPPSFELRWERERERERQRLPAAGEERVSSSFFLFFLLLFFFFERRSELTRRKKTRFPSYNKEKGEGIKKSSTHTHISKTFGVLNNLKQLCSSCLLHFFGKRERRSKTLFVENVLYLGGNGGLDVGWSIRRRQNKLTPIFFLRLFFFFLSSLLRGGRRRNYCSRYKSREEEIKHHARKTL